MSCRWPALFLAFLVLGAPPLHAPAWAQIGEIDAHLTRGRELTKAGKPEQALPYLMLSLELAETRLGDEDPGLVPILEGLASAHTARESYADAEPLYERALAIQERAAERYQSGITRTLNSLGGIYEATNRPREAMAVYRRVLTTWASVLGSDHPQVQVAGGRLAKLALRVPAETALDTRGPDTRAPSVAAPPQAPQPEPSVAEAPAQAPLPAPPRAKPPPPPSMTRAPAVAEAAPAPVPKPVPKPGAKPVRDGPGYAIHLTSIRNPQGAQAEWDRLRRLYGVLLKGLELRVTRVDLGAPRGVYHRIQGGLLTRADARARCAPFRARGAWCGVVRAGEASDAARLAARDAAAVPAQPVAPPAAPAPETQPEDGYLIHLTSIRKREQAEAEWRRLKRLHGALLKGLELTVQRADLGPGRGIYYRIQGGPLKREGAQKLCALFAARKIWCRVARPGEEAAEGPSRLALQRVRRRSVTGPRGTRRGREWLYLRDWLYRWACRRDRGCRRSPFAWPTA